MNGETQIRWVRLQAKVNPFQKVLNSNLERKIWEENSSKLNMLTIDGFAVAAK